MKLILLDTNFFLAPFQTGVDIFSELDRIVNEPFRIITISPVIGELERLSKTAKGEDRSSAKLALELAKGVDIIDYPGLGDEAIIDFARKNKVIVATNDSALRKRLKAAKIRTIFVRNRSKLEIE
jgi:uncharacterized protein